MIDVSELMAKGGAWLGAARGWLQCHKLNGSDVTWGSEDVLQPPMSVRNCEEIAATAVAAALNAADQNILVAIADEACAESDEDGGFDTSSPEGEKAQHMLDGALLALELARR